MEVGEPDAFTAYVKSRTTEAIHNQVDAVFTVYGTALERDCQRTDKGTNMLIIEEAGRISVLQMFALLYHLRPTLCCDQWRRQHLSDMKQYDRATDAVNAFDADQIAPV
jgi:hypothetical protein